MKKKVRSRRRAPVVVEKPDKLISVLAIVAVAFFAAASIAWNFYSDDEIVSFSPECQINKDLILHYDFNQEGGGDVLDMSGNGRYGDLQGSSGGLPAYVNINPATDKTGQYLQLDGVDDRVKILNSQSLHFDSDKTICFWRDSSYTSGQGGTIFSKGLTSTLDNKLGLTFLAPNSNPNMIVYGVSSYSVEATGSSSWEFVCAHFSPTSNNKLVIYVGDMTNPASASHNGPIVYSNEFIHIGAKPVNGVATEFYAGLIDEVTIWDGLLDYNERNELKNYYYTGTSNCDYLPGEGPSEPPAEPPANPPADTTAPTLNIVSPINGSTYSAPTVPLIFVASDENLDYCLYNIGTGVEQVPCQNGVQKSVSGLSPLDVGLNVWTVHARDINGNNVVKSVTFNYNPGAPDTTSPSIQIAFPQNGQTYNPAQVKSLNFTVVDDNPSRTWWNTNVANSSSISYTSGEQVNRVINYNLSSGTYTWKVWANDSIGNLGFASTTFTIDASIPVCNPAPWNAQTTACTPADTKIKYYTSTNSCGQTPPANETIYCDYDGNGIIGNVSELQSSNVDVEIFVDGDELDLDADYAKEDVEIRDEDGNLLVTFEYDFRDEPLNFKDILIKKQSDVTQYGYLIVKGIDADKTFRVDRVAGASKVCIRDRDDVDSAADFTSGCTHSSEELINCPGSGGGYTCTISGDVFVVEGFENSAVKEFLGNASAGPGCVPDWEPGLWGACIGGTRTRTVADLNNCGVSTGKPASSESCTPPASGGACTPNWQCSDWSPNECPSSGFRTRTCTDLNACGTSSGRPSERASCVEDSGSDFNFPLIMAIVLAVLGTATLAVVVILYIKRKKRAKMYSSSSYSTSHYASGSGGNYSYSGTYSRR